jgi:hypothetical protein
MKKVLLLCLLCFSINGFSSTKEFICTYKITFQSNPYDANTYTEKNPKLLDFKQKIIINFKNKLVTREYFNIGWDGEKKIKIKQKRVSPISKASRDLNVPNRLIYWYEERVGTEGISDGQVSIFSLATWTKTTLTHSYISVVSAYDTHYNCVTNN